MGDVQDGNVLANAKVLKSRSSPLEVPMGSEDNSVNNAKTYRYCKFETATSSLTSLQLSQGILEMYEPPLAKAKGQLKELIGKQNKIYIDLSAEKFKIDNAEVIKLQEMMDNVKIYRNKLLKIKKQMQNIYQRTKVLKKRTTNIQMDKQKEWQRKLQKQQHEESLIAKK